MRPACRSRRRVDEPAATGQPPGYSRRVPTWSRSAVASRSAARRPPGSWPVAGPALVGGVSAAGHDVLPATWARRALLETGELSRPPQHGIGRSMKTARGDRRPCSLRSAGTPNTTRRPWSGLDVADRTAGRGADPHPGLTLAPNRRRATGGRVPMTVVSVDAAAFGVPRSRSCARSR